MPVYMLTFFINHVQVRDQVVLLFGREMKCLIDRVREKAVSADMLCQWMMQEKIGVKDQKVTRPAFHVLKI